MTPASGPGGGGRWTPVPLAPSWSPRRRQLQEGAYRAGVHRPPPPGPDAGVIPRTRPPALRAPAPGPGVRAHRHDQDLAVAVRVRLHGHVADDHALDAHQLPEYPGLAHAVSLSVVPVP